MHLYSLCAGLQGKHGHEICILPGFTIPSKSFLPQCDRVTPACRRKEVPAFEQCLVQQAHEIQRISAALKVVALAGLPLVPGLSAS